MTLSFKLASGQVVTVEGEEAVVVMNWIQNHFKIAFDKQRNQSTGTSR
jgi:hypothetical protein